MPITYKPIKGYGDSFQYFGIRELPEWQLEQEDKLALAWIKFKNGVGKRCNCRPTPGYFDDVVDSHGPCWTANPIYKEIYGKSLNRQMNHLKSESSSLDSVTTSQDTSDEEEHEQDAFILACIKWARKPGRYCSCLPKDCCQYTRQWMVWKRYGGRYCICKPGPEGIYITPSHGTCWTTNPMYKAEYDHRVKEMKQDKLLQYNYSPENNVNKASCNVPKKSRCQIM